MLVDGGGSLWAVGQHVVGTVLVPAQGLCLLFSMLCTLLSLSGRSGEREKVGCGLWDLVVFIRVL